MAGYLNKAMIIGNLGRDPEIRSFDNGGKIANLSLATTETWKDKNSGEKREKTEWHRITIRQNGTSRIIDGFIEPYVKKGQKVLVEGKIETRKWTDKDGNDRYSTEIIVAGPNSSFELLSSSGKSDADDSSFKPTTEKEFEDTIPDWD
jgi:single-strand DNA-binding protein